MIWAIWLWIKRRLFVLHVHPDLFWKWIKAKPGKRGDGSKCEDAGDCVNYIGCGPGHRCDYPCKYCLYWTGYGDGYKTPQEDNNG